MEDVKVELRILATFLGDSYCRTMEPEQLALIVELVVMKMRALAE